MSYHQFVASQGDLYGSFEVFYRDQLVEVQNEVQEWYWMFPGWYWYKHSPDWLRDDEPIGPFDTEDEAIADAQATD